MLIKNIFIIFTLVSIAPLSTYAMLAPVAQLSQKQVNLNAELKAAALEGNVEKAKSLIARGANNNSLLEDVIREEDSRCAIETLINAGTEINQQNSLGYTPLHKAIANYHLDNVVTLIALGANPHLRLKDMDYDLKLFPHTLKTVALEYTPLELARNLTHLPRCARPIIIVLENMQPTQKEIKRLSQAILSLRRSDQKLPKDLVKNIMPFKLVDAIAEEKMEKIKNEMTEADDADSWKNINKYMLKKALKRSLLREYIIPTQPVLINYDVK